jgi:hypothetical protein
MGRCCVSHVVTDHIVSRKNDHSLTNICLADQEPEWMIPYDAFN